MNADNTALSTATADAAGTTTTTVDNAVAVAATATVTEKPKAKLTKKAGSKPAAKKAAGKKPAARVAAKGTGRKPSGQKQAKRPPAAELMANRKRMFFGSAYLNGVLGGYHRDFDKMVQHAAHLKVGTPSALKKLSLETLRSKLAEAITNTPNGAEPFSIRLDA